MITSTICVALILFFVTLFFRINRTELHTITESFKGILSSAALELRFRGGRAAKSNVILCVVLAILFTLLTLHGTIYEIAALLGMERGQSGPRDLYILFGMLILFFLASLGYIFASERYNRRMGR